MELPKVPKKLPYFKDVKPGQYAWCSCGLSKSQPYCDGSHVETDFEPVIEKLDKEKAVAWCGCKHSQNGAYCDGSHIRL